MPFCFKIDKNHNFQENSNVTCGVNNGAIYASKVLNKALWKEI